MAQRRSRSRSSIKAASRAPLPAGLAFVVQLRADADLPRGRVQGRVEHVISGTAARFESLDQLLGFRCEAGTGTVSGPAPDPSAPPASGGGSSQPSTTTRRRRSMPGAAREDRT
jgi:hypothetical protein